MSLSQWTSRKTRVHATVTAIPTAAPARRRAGVGSSGPSTSAAAAQTRRPRSCGRSERTARELRDRVEGRSDSVEDLLDPVDEQPLADEHGDEEDWDPSGSGAGGSRRPRRLRPRGGGVRLAELCEEIQAAVPDGAGVVGAPLRHAGVDVDERELRPHEVRQGSEEQPAYDDGHQCGSVRPSPWRPRR